jgi:hypothetical protein
MNTLEASTYCEPDFDLINEFIGPEMTPEQIEETRKKTAEMYANFTDDDWRALGDNY